MMVLLKVHNVKDESGNKNPNSFIVCTGDHLRAASRTRMAGDCVPDDDGAEVNGLSSGGTSYVQIK